MTWDWAIDTFKGLIVAAITWVVIHLRKQAKPLIKSLKKLSKIIETTEELRNRVAVLESEKQALYDIIKDPLFVLKPNGEVKYANNAYAKEFGFHDPRDAYGFGYMAIIPDEDREKIERQSEQSTEHPSPFEGQIRFKHRQTGAIIITECRTALFFDTDNKLIGTLGRLYIID